MEGIPHLGKDLLKALSIVNLVEQLNTIALLN
jgi:hypothetical protein